MTDELDPGHCGPPKSPVGGILPQSLAARQGRQEHPRRQLHGGVLLDGPRQGRDHHVGAAGDGLSQNDVNSILQDSRGFMWFGTYDGLNKYDGYEFIAYP